MEKLHREVMFDISGADNSLHFVHDRGFSNPDSFHLHMNHYYELYFYIEGDVEYFVDDRTYTLTKGDVIAINPYKVHRAVLKSSCMYERFYILVPETAFQSFSSDPLIPIRNLTNSPLCIIQPNESRRKATLDLLNTMSDLSTRSGKSAKAALCGCFLQLLGILGMQLDEKNQPTETTKANTDDLISKILVYIEKNLISIDSVGNLADEFHLSLPYFCSYFKNHMGISAKSYLQAKKIALAKRLLDEGRSISDTCYEIGYCDCSYFIKVFRKHVGRTPSQYQKRQNIDTAVKDENSM